MRNSNSDFFDMMAPEWDSITMVDSPKISHILDVAAIGRGESALDVGTGTGVLVPYIVERVGKEGRIDAVDVSQGMLKVAKSKFGHLENVDFIHADVESDSLPKQYDHIIMYCMYPHLLSPEETVEWLVKVNLKPGGNLVIAFPQSKESINGLHHHNDGSVHSTHIIDGYLLKARLALRGLNADYIEDTPDCYIVRISK